MASKKQNQNKENSSSENRRIRYFIGILLAINAAICTITAVDFFDIRREFPSWFTFPFLMACIVLLYMIVFSLLSLRKIPSEPVNGLSAFLIWVLLISSIICTSALHKFYPFRPNVFECWRQMSAEHNILKFNFILTAVSLLATILLGMLYYARKRHLAITGLVILAGCVLIPTCDCGNAFNRIWIRWLSASPLMFMPNSVLILVGSCALLGIRQKFNIVNMAIINWCVLALGLGHLTKIVW